MKIFCCKCKCSFDPEIQAAECRGSIRHYPIKKDAFKLPGTTSAPDKPKQRAPFQSDFMLLWDEPCGRSVSKTSRL